MRVCASAVLLGLLLCTSTWRLPLVGSNTLLSMVVQQQVVVLEFLQEMSARPSTLPSCSIFFKYVYTHHIHTCIYTHMYIYVTCCCSWLSHVWLFVTPWTASCQASLSFTVSRNLFKLMYIELVVPSTVSPSVTTFSCPQSFSASEFFLMSELFASGGQIIGTSASTSITPINIQA